MAKFGRWRRQLKLPAVRLWRARRRVSSLAESRM